MSYNDGSFCPWPSRAHKKLMEIPTTFLRWAVAERPEMVDKYPGLRDYIATRIGATGCVRSTTREARPAPWVKPPKKDRENPVSTPVKSPQKSAPPSDLFALAEAMRKATQ